MADSHLFKVNFPCNLLAHIYKWIGWSVIKFFSYIYRSLISLIHESLSAHKQDVKAYKVKSKWYIKRKKKSIKKQHKKPLRMRHIIKKNYVILWVNSFYIPFLMTWLSVRGHLRGRDENEIRWLLQSSDDLWEGIARWKGQKVMSTQLSLQ